MKKGIITVICLLIGAAHALAQETIDLSGPWQFQLDPEKKGHEAKWFLKDKFNDQVTLPGTTDTNKKGFKVQPWPSDEITRKFEFPAAFDQPDWIYEINSAPSRRYKYIGPAWYQKVVEIPQEWAGKRLEIFLERSLFKMELWVDEKKVGENVSLYAPRRFDITDYVAFCPI